MKNPKRPFGKFLLAATITLAMMAAARPVNAQATIEFYGENGSNPPSVGMSWFGGGNTAGGWFEPNDINALEGTKYQSFTSASATQGYWGFAFAPGAQNMTAYNNGTIRFLLRSTEDLALQVEYGVSGVVALSIPNTGGVWRERVVDLKLFVNQGVDMSTIRVPFLIRRVGAPLGQTTWSVDHIRWCKAISSIDVVPTTTFQTTGRKRQYTTIGRDSAGEEVIVYGSWFTTGGSEYSVSASTDSRYTVVTIGTGSSNIRSQVTTSNSNFSTTSAIIPINPGPAQDTTLGLLSETIPGLIFGTDSDFGTYFDATVPAASITTSDELTDFREGSKSTKVVLNVPASTPPHFAGFFIQQGVGANETVVRNMSDYYDGSIRFWLKAPAALSGKLDMSIRTGGVGAELSKVTIGASHGMVYDNTWRAIVVPVAQLAKAVPFAELSRMKVLFNMSVSAASGSGGTQTFYIDNIRWDTRLPGPLNSIVIKPTGTTGARVRIPKNLKRTFIARGFDGPNGTGVEVDITPTWAISGAIGTLVPFGTRARLDASATPALGSIRATQGAIFADTFVDVANIVFTQNFNVYSDAGSSGPIGIDTCATCPDSLVLNGSHGTSPPFPEGKTVMHATYTLVNSAGGDVSYAAWFVYETVGTRYLSAYSDGYLHFWIKTGRDLEISINSDNITPGTGLAKMRLSDLGVPLDNTWQEVWLALDDFKQLDNRLDFSLMKVFWSIAAVSNQIGQVANQVYQVDDVRWYTANPEVADVNKVYAGIKNKQGASGLVLTYDNNTTSRAVTYDQALAAMAYTYRLDRTEAARVLDVYKTKYNNGAGFAGFHNEYERNTLVASDPNREAGPNAWIMMAALHYKAASGSTTYDAMITGIANWLLTLQDPGDKAIRLGYRPTTLDNAKSTEHNFDVYAVFKAHKMITGLNTYDTAANNILTWLTTSSTAGSNPGAWNVAQGRFNTGRTAGGVANTDFALDTYSWAPLALSSYTAVVSLAEAAFVGIPRRVDVNGNTMTGFDFSGVPGNGTSIPYGQPVDKDAVWIEGTAHMVLAYLAANNQAKANQYLNELDKAVYTVGVTSQALAYASNAGTAYFPGLMDSTHGSLSSMCWYLFAKAGFNPLQPVPLWGVTIKNISNDLPVATVGFSVTMPARWVRANQYIEYNAQPADIRPWGLAIYTDNRNAGITPRFQDPTPGITMNADSNPAGMLLALPGATTTHHRLDMGWRVEDSMSPPPAAVQPFSTFDGTGSFQWFYMKDKTSPAIDVNGDGDTNDPVDRPGYSAEDPYMKVESNQGIRTAGGSFNPSLGPDYIFLEADFSYGAAQVPYKANILLEYYIQ